jgi:RHS repeat-associated protein
MHAGFEIAYANIEEAMFDNISEVRDNSPTGVPGDLLSARLNGSVDSTRIGAAVLMHVMAGDELNFQAYGYYEAMDSTQLSTYAAPEDMAAQLVTTLVNGGGNAGLENANPFTAPTISTLLSPENYSLYEDIKNNITDPNYPRAYLNYLVFNEDMQLLPDKCIVVQLKGTTDNWHQLTLPASQPIEENGYALCYLSNETAADVFMDNASMVNIKGRLLEENLYYPHGLLVDLGRQASLSFENKYLYQGKSLQSELELELYDFHARQYDPQIGRFWGIDPADQFPSGYTGMGNDPANNIDPSGMYVVSTLGGGMEEYWAYNRQLADEKAYADAMEPFAPLYSAKQMADEMMNAMYNAGTEETDGQFQEQESIVDKVSTAINAKSETEQKDPASEENQLKKFMETLPEGTRELFEKSIELVKKKKEQDEEKFYGAEVQGDKDKKTSNQEAEGKIDIYRTWETDKSTTSTFTTGDGSVKGFILEPAGPSTTERNTDHRIPEGTYSTKLEYSPHFKRMLYTISNNLVPPDRRVLIHSGNGPNDTEACLIPGSSRSVDRVWGSKETLRALMQYIGSFKGNVKVTIHDPKRP